MHMQRLGLVNHDSFIPQLFRGPEAPGGAAAAHQRAPRQAAARRRGHELPAEGAGRPSMTSRIEVFSMVRKLEVAKICVSISSTVQCGPTLSSLTV